MTDTVVQAPPPPPRAEWENSYKRPNPLKGWLIAGIAIVVLVLAIVGGKAINNYEITHSISYRDGWAAGGPAVETNSASTDCNNAWQVAENNPGDNETQWIMGCEGGWEASQHEANQTNSGNSGNSGSASTTQSTYYYCSVGVYIGNGQCQVSN
jgi:hypothetical protein